MFRNFKLLVPPPGWGRQVGVIEKADHPPLTPPIMRERELATECLT